MIIFMKSVPHIPATHMIKILNDCHFWCGSIVVHHITLGSQHFLVIVIEDVGCELKINNIMLFLEYIK